MAMQRRAVIGTALGAATAMMVGPVTALAAQSSGAAAAGGLDYAAFQSFRRNWFFLAGMDSSASGMAGLLAVRDLSIADDCEQFQLVFLPGRGASLPTGRYHAYNWRGFPEFDIYVQATTNQRGRPLLTATFALLSPVAAASAS